LESSLKTEVASYPVSFIENIKNESKSLSIHLLALEQMCA
jgi:hypothetical protein